MKFAQGTLALALALVLFSACDAAFDVQRAKQLAKITRTTALLKGNKKNIKRFVKAVKMVRQKFPTCSPNVCFALDGSGSINATEWALQKSFVTVAIATLGGLTGSKFAAVEYAAVTKPIIEDLSPASPQMLKDVEAASRTGGFTFIGPAIQWCSSKVRLDRAAVNKIILLGDARSTFGNPYGLFGAVNLAKRFREQGPGHGTCAGLVEPRKAGRLDKNLKLFSDIVGDSDLVYREPAWADMTTVVLALVELICKA